MIDYEVLKNCYIGAFQMGLDLGFSNPKQGNELLHKFCENLVDNSNYSEFDKQKMKQDLELVKETLSQEIELRFRGTQQ